MVAAPSPLPCRRISRVVTGLASRISGLLVEICRALRGAHARSERDQRGGKGYWDMEALSGHSRVLAFVSYLHDSGSLPRSWSSRESPLPDRAAAERAAEELKLLPPLSRLVSDAASALAP